MQLPALAVLAAVAAAVAAWRRERRRCFLLDFACYKPPDGLKVELSGFLEGSRKFGVRKPARPSLGSVHPLACSSTGPVSACCKGLWKRVLAVGAQRHAHQGR